MGEEDAIPSVPGGGGVYERLFGSLCHFSTEVGGHKGPGQAAGARLL